MPVQLTLCRLCTLSRPDIIRTIARLVSTYPNELVVVELDCMAACDDVPAVMIETDYFPKVSPPSLEQIVCERVCSSRPIAAD